MEHAKLIGSKRKGIKKRNKQKMYDSFDSLFGSNPDDEQIKKFEN